MLKHPAPPENLREGRQLAKKLKCTRWLAILDSLGNVGYDTGIDEGATPVAPPQEGQEL
jgi:hypothetical protein